MNCLGKSVCVCVCVCVWGVPSLSPLSSLGSGRLGIAFVLYYQQNQPVLLSERGNCFSVAFNSAKFFHRVHQYDLFFSSFFSARRVTCEKSVDFQSV